MFQANSQRVNTIDRSLHCPACLRSICPTGKVRIFFIWKEFSTMFLGTYVFNLSPETKHSLHQET